MRVLQLLLLATVVYLTNGARILGIFNLASNSHFQLGEMLLTRLASRGHEVTMITPMQGRKEVKNFRIISTANADRSSKNADFDIFALAHMSALASNLGILHFMLPEVEGTLNHSNVRKLIASDEKFDLVIVERLLNDAFHGFCAHYQAHCVILSPIPPMQSSQLQMGNIILPSYNPDIQSSLPTTMNFFERVYNSLIYLTSTIVFYTSVLPAHNELMHKYFPTVSQDLVDIFYNVSITLLNTHNSISRSIPLSPNMIDIGGYHIKPPKAIPGDLKQYLDSASEGVILFSLGSNLRSKDLTVERREAILNAFAGLNVKVLWKWENETLPDQPSNVKIAKWIPQNDVLAHPNIKLFVTHGGLLSTFEAVYHGVPMVGIPVYGDQNSNMKIAEENHYGVSLPLAELSEENLLRCIKTVLQDPKYLENARARSEILRDNPVHPLDKAVYWIEYVLRHNGAHHLKSAALNLSWFQYLLLDIVLFIAISITLPIYMCCKVCKRNPKKLENEAKKTQ